ncbi:hypothetical protein MKW94_005252 [Papaver nudicaule]|uniref:Uncharacterized protein n=1 Tax=Papaver nudicaule TaxID=74823 RepID=A0AA42B1N8_PAPNU|nr:hypothetical protein [Papaver nudicaule]
MVFFDFNVPYLEPGKKEKPLPDNDAKKNTRLKIAVKAMELGYSGIAYNRCMKGVMSDNDSCTIFPFPLSSLLKLLKVPLNTPFRQYTRLTVIVENIVQAGVLNSGNPVLKTYDLVAVKPLNQSVFDHVCKVSEVDLVAIDFSERLPFRLKLPMVKAAIERGIYFEITYSHLISDIQARRQMVTNAKLLVDWTRGKDIIFTSGASSVNELRGPYDVANLSSLLGLSMERAKAATSKNCRALIARAIRKKQFYKEAVRVEKIPSSQQVDTKESWFADYNNNWDEISSGEGDIQLDDIAKFFAASIKLNDWLPTGGNKSQQQEDTPMSDAKSDESLDMDKISKEPIGSEVVFSHPKSLFSTSVEHPTSSTPILFLDVAEIVLHDTPPHCISTTGDVKLILPDNVVSSLTSERESGTSFSCLENLMGLGSVGSVLTPKNHVHTTFVDDLAFPMETSGLSTPSKESDIFPQIVDSKTLNSSDDALGAHDAVNMENFLSKTEERKQIELASAGFDMFIVIGKGRVRRPAFPFPLHRMSKPIIFKKKSRKIKF